MWHVDEKYCVNIFFIDSFTFSWLITTVQLSKLVLCLQQLHWISVTVISAIYLCDSVGPAVCRHMIDGRSFLFGTFEHIELMPVEW